MCGLDRHVSCLQIHFRNENARRDRTDGKYNPGMYVDTSELADKVRALSILLRERSSRMNFFFFFLYVKGPGFRYVP